MVDPKEMVARSGAGAGVRAGALTLVEKSESPYAVGREEKGRGRKVLPMDVAIARLLKATRLEKKLTVTECSELVGTTRRRYGAIEKGEAPLGAAEMLILTRFLGVPAQRMWDIGDGTESGGRESGQGNIDGENAGESSTSKTIIVENKS